MQQIKKWQFGSYGVSVIFLLEEAVVALGEP
jgi:S-adenosylmethionine/arginine decarboxylase-like enzyme